MLDYFFGVLAFMKEHVIFSARNMNAKEVSKRNQFYYFELQRKLSKFILECCGGSGENIIIHIE